MIPRILLWIGLTLLVAALPVAADELPIIHLKIVGGLDGTSQYIDREGAACADTWNAIIACNTGLTAVVE